MTEAEARKKWCPFSMTGAYTDRGPTMAVSVNRDPREAVQSSCLCIASDCMAWQEHFTDEEDDAGECGLAR